MSKKGVDYELFVKDVYECLNKADGLKDVKIQHDVKLKGAAGVEHQIDLFWFFKFGGIAYRVAIECKDYNSRVSKEKIEAFHDILNDIGNIHGIFASRMGFQSGAVAYAEKYGIQLMEIRHPIEKDWEGKIRHIHLELNVCDIQNVHTSIVVDIEKFKKMNITQLDRKRFIAKSDAVIVDFSEMVACEQTFAEGKKSMHDMVKIIQAYDSKPGVGKKQIFSFSNGVINHEGMKLPIDAIEFTYDICMYKDNIHINGDDVIKAIVKNIIEKTELHIDKFGRTKEIQSTIDGNT